MNKLFGWFLVSAAVVALTFVGPQTAQAARWGYRRGRYVTRVPRVHVTVPRAGVDVRVGPGVSVHVGRAVDVHVGRGVGVHVGLGYWSRYYRGW